MSLTSFLKMSLWMTTSLHKKGQGSEARTKESQNPEHLKSRRLTLSQKEREKGKGITKKEGTIKEKNGVISCSEA